jgi:colanic acid/amylovoran biosynthesis protein
MNIYLTGQNNFGNRGCEALVRSTIDVVREQIPDATFIVPSLNIGLDSGQWPDASAYGVRFVPNGRIPSRFIQWNRVCSRLPMLTRFGWPGLRGSDELPPGFCEADAVLSIGGDNYSLDYDLASLAYFVAVADAGLARGIPVFLWGASAGPFNAIPGVERHMAEHLRRLTRVTIREAHSVAYLSRIGVAENLVGVVDTAFAMRPEAVDTAPFWPTASREGVLGLNVSPLVAAVRARAGKQSDFIGEVAAFIRQCVEDHGFSVLLIPHVAPLDGSARNNDEVFLGEIAKRCGDHGGKVSVVPSGMNAVQLKHIIGQCRLFIGARTHATIAALSMNVPTLSIAYSVKALGINNDLFGHQRYVLDTRDLDAASLGSGLSTLLAEEEDARQLLAVRLPEWRQRARIGATHLAQALQERAVTPA